MKPQWLIALCVIPHAPQLRADDLGRLFLDSSQRQTLEQQRHATLSPEGRVALDGVVRPKGRDGTIWLNGRPQPEGRPAPTNLDGAKPEHDPASAWVTDTSQGWILLRVGGHPSTTTTRRDSARGSPAP